MPIVDAATSNGDTRAPGSGKCSRKITPIDGDVLAAMEKTQLQIGAANDDCGSDRSDGGGDRATQLHKFSLVEYGQTRIRTADLRSARSLDASHQNYERANAQSTTTTSANSPRMFVAVRSPRADLIASDEDDDDEEQADEPSGAFDSDDDDDDERFLVARSVSGGAAAVSSSTRCDLNKEDELLRRCLIGGGGGGCDGGEQRR